MTKNSLAVAIVAALVGALAVFLYSAVVAPPTVAKMPKACGEGNCPIAINLYLDCSDPNNILASPEKAPIARGNSNPRLEWTIYKTGYTFAANGIDFHGDPQFTRGQILGDQKFQWFDSNSDTTYHKYTVNLLHDGVPCPPLDPGIINGQ